MSEIRVIDRDLLIKILKNTFNKPVVEDWQIIQDEILGSDIEDGGADHRIILKKVSENRFYQLYYSDWDLEYNSDCDLDTGLAEVFPKEKTITVYE